MMLGWLPMNAQGFTTCNHQVTEYQQSDVIMSHAELQNLLETIIKARRARMMRARYNPVRQYAYQPPPPPPQQNNSQELAEMQSLLKELDGRMKSSNSTVERKELEEMRASILRDLNNPKNQPNVIIHNNIKTDSTRVAYQPQDNSDIKEELERLKNELKKERNTTPAPQVIIKEAPNNTISDQRYNDLMAKYEALLKQVNAKPVLETRIVYKESEPRIIYKESAPKILYKETAPRLEEKEWFNNRRVIYFDNAAHALRSESNRLLDEIAGLMSRHISLKVVIKGFASKKGSPEYNLLLSERRADSIKSGLMKRGIDASRITSDFHGIDYRPANEQEARRAEIIFLAH